MKFVFTILFLCFNVFSQAQPFELKRNDVIALTGGSNIERTRFNGYLQTSLIASKPELKIKVRNFGWEGDTVFEQWRDGGNYQNLDPKRAQAEKRISAELRSNGTGANKTTLRPSSANSAINLS